MALTDLLSGIFNRDEEPTEAAPPPSFGYTDMVGPPTDEQIDRQAVAQELQGELEGKDYSGDSWKRFWGGFGAGMAGAGESYLANLSKERKGALVQDALRINSYLKEGDVKSAVDLLGNRIENINRLGGDASDSMGLLDRLARGDIAGAVKDTDLVLEAAYQSGQFERPKSEAEKRYEEARARMAELNVENEPARLAAEAEMQGWEIKQIQSKIGYDAEQLEINKLRSKLDQAKDEREATQLRIDLEDRERKLAQEMRDQVASVRSGMRSYDTGISTVARLRTNPALAKVVGSIQGGENWLAALNRIGDDDAMQAIADIESLKSQGFLDSIQNAQQSLTPLSDKDAEMLVSAFQNLDRRQGEESFIQRLDDIDQLLSMGRAELSKSYGAPIEAEAGSIAYRDSVLGEVTQGDLNEFMRDNGIRNRAEALRLMREAAVRVEQSRRGQGSRR